MDEVKVLIFKICTVAESYTTFTFQSVINMMKGKSRICLSLQMKKPNRTFAEKLELLI